MIKGIFFDAAGILYCRNSPTADFALDLLRQQGFSVEVPGPELTRLDAMRTQASQGQISHTLYWEQFLLVRGVIDPKRRIELVEQITDYSNDILPVPGSREALEGLKKRGFILGIVTDTMYPVEWKMRRLTKAGVADFIDVIACSTALGLHKPDPAMYLIALQQAHLAPGEAAFVGHDATEIRGACQAGIITVAVNYEADVRADYYCQRMLDLLDLPIFQGRITSAPIHAG